MKLLSKASIFLLGVLVSSVSLLSMAAQENIILGVQTTTNASSQVEKVADTGQSSNEVKIGVKDYAIQEDNVVEEIRSSFEDLSVSEDRTKVKEDPHPEPTLQFYHQHANIATE